MLNSKIEQIIQSVPTEYFDGLDHPQEKKQLSQLLSIVSKNHSLKTILDLNAGHGNKAEVLSKWLPQAKFKLVEQDASLIYEGCLRFAYELSRFQFHNTPVKNLKIKAQTIDLILVPNNLLEDTFTVQACQKWVKKGGTMLVHLDQPGLASSRSSFTVIENEGFTYKTDKGEDSTDLNWAAFSR